MEYYPRTINWELTSKRTRESGPGEIGTELGRDPALSIASQLNSLHVEKVNLAGDDTLKYSSWPVLVSTLARNGIKVELITYAPIPEKETIDKIHDSGITKIIFGLDGLAANHDFVHKRPDLFKSILNDIENALSANLQVGVVTMVSDKNIDDLPMMLYIIHAAGITNWKLQAMTVTSPWHVHGNIPIGDNTFQRLRIFLQLMGPQAKKLGISLELADNIGYYDDGDTRALPWNGCPGGKSECAITCNGMVKGCLLLTDALIEGDLHKRPFAEIWQDPSSFAYTRQFDKANLGPNCTDCGHWEECRGGCSAMSLTLTGRMHNNPFCFCGMESREQ